MLIKKVFVSKNYRALMKQRLQNPNDMHGLRIRIDIDRFHYYGKIVYLRERETIPETVSIDEELLFDIEGASYLKVSLIYLRGRNGDSAE